MEFVIDFLGRQTVIRPGTQDSLRGKWGFTDINKLEIEYGDHLAEANQKETVFHETIHLCDLLTCTDADELSEAQVQRIGCLLFSLLRDNRHLTRWIFGFNNEEVW
jgi:hypothetical protein